VYILTADQEFARECGKAPQRLAASLIDDIRAAFRPPAAPTPSQRLRRRAVRDSDAEAVSAAAKLTPEELLNCAVEYRRRGDEEYDEGNVAAALSQYRTAVDLCPSYAVARIRLVDALIEKGNTEEARAQLGELRKLSGLGKTDLAEIARQEKRLR
jgi:tetratricopeptide (TPR) repeat protein